MSAAAKFRGAHAPRVVRLAPSPIAENDRSTHLLDRGATGSRRARRERHPRARALPNQL
jgi:hypothetical protein